MASGEANRYGPMQSLHNDGYADILVGTVELASTEPEKAAGATYLIMGQSF
jgi:hypothetical protein